MSKASSLASQQDGSKMPDGLRSETVLTRITALRAPRLMRGLEFAGTLSALAVSFAAVIITDLRVLGAVSQNLLIPGAAYILAVFGFHLLVRWKAPDSDPLILPLAVLLNSLGIMMIYRIDLDGGEITAASTSVRQVLWSVIALAAAGAVLLLLKNHRVLLRFTYLSGAIAILLMLLPYVPGIGLEIAGARQWIRIFGFTFQPVELAKIALTIFFAGYLVRGRDALSMVGKKIGPLLLPRARDLGPLLLIWLLAMSVLVFQRELGTSVLIFGLFLALLYVATGRIGWVVLGGALFIGGGLIASQTLSYVNSRFANWLDPFRDAQGQSFQLVQGLFGMANGGLTGTGLGSGYPMLTPLAESDYIVPSLAEELGLIGVVAVLLAYLLLVERGLRISFAVHDDFGKLFSVGLAFTLALQIFVVVGGVTRIIPLTGLTSPFLAAGGSSLLANWIIVALFILMSNAVRNRPKLVIRQ